MNSVRTRILLFFTLFAFASFFAVLMSSRSTRIIGNAANSVVSRHLPMVVALGEMDLALQRHDNEVHRYVITTDKIWLDQCEKERQEYTHWFTQAEELSAPEEEDKLTEIDELYVQYENQCRHLLLARKSKPGDMPRMLAESDQFLRQIQTLVDQMKAFREGMTVEQQNQIRDTLRRHSTVAFYFLVIIGLFFAFLAFYLWHFLVHPLSLLLDGIRNFTRGKVDVQIPSVGKDELGELQEAFNEMSRELGMERKRLKTESQSDPLTGLFNMRYFKAQLVEEFSRAQRYGRPLTMLMIDVDYFKMYNDRNGHPAGDIVLKEVSRILIRNVRGTDIIARYGGEEFVVLLPETPSDAAVNVAEKIRKAVEEHFFPFGGSESGEKLTVSIGIASYPDSHVTSDQDLIESSDKALYAAKKSGRNKVFIFMKGNLAPAIAVHAAESSSTIQS